MANHPRTVNGYEDSLERLVLAIGNMAYDQAASFIEMLADDFKRQADADKDRGRIKLAKELYAAAEKMYEARDKVYLAWKICEPYMKE